MSIINTWPESKISQLKQLISEPKKQSLRKISKQLEIKIYLIKLKITELKLDYKWRTGKCEQIMDKILELVDRGLNSQEISHLTGIGFSSIACFCRTNHIDIKLHHHKKDWNNEIDNPLLIEAFNSSLNLRGIAKMFHKNTDFIAAKMDELGLFTEQRIKILMNQGLKTVDRKICWDCGEEKSLDSEFYKKTQKSCIECCQIKSKKLNDAIKEPNLKKIFSKRLAEAKGRLNREFDLTLEFLFELFENQGGKCFYTGDILADYTNSRNTVSLDRIDSNKGYTKDNTVLSTRKMNLLKNDLGIFELLDLVENIFKNTNQIKEKLEEQYKISLNSLN